MTRLRFRLSAPSFDPKSEGFLSLLDFSVAFPKLPEDEKTGRQNHLAENRISRILFRLPAKLCTYTQATLSWGCRGACRELGPAEEAPPCGLGPQDPARPPTVPASRSWACARNARFPST